MIYRFICLATTGIALSFIVSNAHDVYIALLGTAFGLAIFWSLK